MRLNLDAGGLRWTFNLLDSTCGHGHFLSIMVGPVGLGAHFSPEQLRQLSELLAQAAALKEAA